MKRTGRGGLSIFARTFLLVAAALLVAQGIGIALLVMRTPIFSPPVLLPEVVALLSSQMPSENTRLKVYAAPLAPAMPEAKGYREDPRMQAALAQWLEVDTAQVRFYRRLQDGLPVQVRFHRRLEDGLLPTDGPLPGLGAGLPPEPRDGPRPYDRPLPNLPPNQEGESPASAPPGVPPFSDGPAMRFGMHEDFIAGVRQTDGHWRVIEYAGGGLSGRFKRQVALLFVLGLLATLPMAWWFSRALSAPIRRFADAADRLGQNPDSPALPRSGPPELVQAADSFNAMQARLNRLLNERTHMVAAIAHDLRTPLARLAFRLDGVPPALREKAAADIEEMKAMIAAALDFIRDHSRAGLREPLDFRLLVESVVDDLIDTGHEVTFEPGASVVLSGDPLALRRMVMNLVENALKYGQRARLSLAAEGSGCRLRIDDDGPGIDPTQREQLFMPFFRGEASRNRDTGGIGLGLSAAHSIALAHGGEIGLDNRTEGGLRVTVLLPCMPQRDAGRKGGSRR
ncbi:ATP-binding protein [Pseudoxanthomonas wuyuanensis]